MFKRESGDWTRYRSLPEIHEVDFHFNELGRREVPYWEAMDEVYEMALDALRKAQEEGIGFVLFRHGSSTSRIGKTTARSVVRGLMRSPEATPYIIRRECIQHYSVFVAAVRPREE